jgi:membrane protease YdiL (CAAX protease family)
MVSMQVNDFTPEADQSLSAWRAIVIFLVYFLVQLVVGFGLGTCVGAYLAATRGPAGSSAISEAMAPLILPISMVGIVVAGLLAFGMTRRTLPGSITQGALAPIGWRPSAIPMVGLAGLTGGLLSFFCLFVLVPAHPPAEGQQWGVLAASAAMGGWTRLLWALLALLLAPPIEEFLFRGVLFSGLSNALGRQASAFLVTVVFVIMHATEALGYWPVWASLCLLAGATVLFRIQSQSLLPAIAAHTGYNLILVIAVYFGVGQ